MKLQILEKELEQDFDKIVKTKDSILCYVKDKIVSAYKGINNWDAFKVINGEFTKEIDIKDQEKLKDKMLMKSISDLILESKRKDNLNMQLVKMVNDLNLKINKLEEK